jgi:hypothetical protein
MVQPVLFAADSIRQPSGILFPVACPDFAYSLIGSVSFADWSLHARRPNPLGSDRCRLHHRSGDDVGGDAMDRVAPRLPGAAWQSMVRAGGLADLLSAGLLLVVVSFDAYAPAIFVEGASSQRRAASSPSPPPSSCRSSGRGGAQRRHLWIGAMGRGTGNPQAGCSAPMASCSAATRLSAP